VLARNEAVVGRGPAGHLTLFQSGLRLAVDEHISGLHPPPYLCTLTMTTNCYSSNDVML